MDQKNKYFRYPDNLNILDLATLVSMYRSRGEPVKAASGEYYACAETRKLVKEAKFWFGLYYSQTAWNQYLTPDSRGYPLTDVEMNILARVLYPPEDNAALRSQVEESLDIVPQLAFLIINDLKQFGFLQEDEGTRLNITSAGELALQGIASRVYQKPFSPDMFRKGKAYPKKPEMERAKKSPDSQTRLF